MKKSFTLNRRAISNLVLIILLLVSFTIGAALSYMFTIAPYVYFPRKTNTLVVTNATFLTENATHFNFTVLNPSYSPDPDVTITRVAIQPENETELYDVSTTKPGLPYPLERGTSQTFQCHTIWGEGAWGEFAGQNITIHVFAVGVEHKTSGPVYSYETRLVNLTADATFDSTKTIEHFNVTVRNDPQSTIGLNITRIEAPAGVPIPPENVIPSLTSPYWLPPGNQTTFTCAWNWVEKKVTNKTVIVVTSQGYEARYPVEDLPSVYLTIPKVRFNATDGDYYFNVTVQNLNMSSPHTYVNVSRIVLTMENGTEHEINGTLVHPKLTPPCPVDQNSSQTFRCPWDWSHYRNKNVTITVYTKQGFICSYKTVTPPPVILKIVGDPYFNLADTSHFNVTVKNSPYSIGTANITKISAADAIITGNDTSPSLPYSLGVNETQSFNCTWETWNDYKGKNITITVHYYGNFTLDEFETSCTFEIPFANITTNVVFNSTVEGIKYFNITVYNTLYRNVTFAKVVVTLENEETFEIDATMMFPSSQLGANQTSTFTCVWNWMDHKGREVTITLYTTEGLKVYYTTFI